MISLQTLMAYPVTIGGRTALERQGYAHYLPQTQQTIHLYSDKKLPSWLHKLPIDEDLVIHNRQRLWSRPEHLSPLSLEIPIDDSHVVPDGLRINQWGQWRWPLVISTAERAYLELLDELPDAETFHMADMIMEGLVNISPRRIQVLLETINSIKVKRLFFFFAGRHHHQWLNRIDRNKINLGSGKRVLIKGGKLDPTYLITVPKELMGDFA